MRSVWTAVPLIFALASVSACGHLSSAPPGGSKAYCQIDKPIGFAEGDTEETKRRIVEHDRRLYCLCPDVYPRLHEKMACPER